MHLHMLYAIGASLDISTSNLMQTCCGVSASNADLHTMDASWAMRHEDSGSCSRTYSNGVALYYYMSLKYDANLPFPLIPKVIYWIEIWWQWRPFGYSEFIDWDNLSFVTWCTILLEAAIGCQYTVDIKGWTWSVTCPSLLLQKT